MFDKERKKILPLWPNNIAVITSPKGAAITDIISVCKRRFPLLSLTVISSLVQGDTAKFELVDALKLAEKKGGFDVILFARGGGSPEDLWPFNEEIVVRAIAESSIPIISAVGHEIDFTIADFVADHRASTPSAAAELVSKNSEDILKQLATTAIRLHHLIANKVQKKAHALDSIKKRLRHPKDQLREQSQRLDDLEIRLQQAFKLKFEQSQKLWLHAVNQTVNASKILNKLNNCQNKLLGLTQRLNQCLENKLSISNFNFEKIVAQLHAVSPLAVLSRGYALATYNDTLIHDSKQLKQGNSIHVQFHLGSALCTVDALKK